MPIKKLFGILSLLFFVLLTAASCTFTNGNMPLSFYDPQAEVDSWLASLHGKTPAEQAELASKVWASPQSSRELRNRAAFILAAHPGQQCSVARHSLYLQYINSNEQQQIAMEKIFRTELEKADNAALTKLAASITSAQENAFPYCLTLWEAASRGLLKDSRAILSRLKMAGVIRDQSIAGGVQMQQPSADTSGSVAIALLLPASGNVSSLSAKITAGAAEAEKALNAAGRSVKVLHIDTESPDWISTVNALPSNCAVLGGPLQQNRLTELERSGVTSNRAVFAFLPRLDDPSKEGRVEWRFFTAPEDQIRSAIDIASTQLGVSSFGIFSPANLYANGMSDLFRKEAAGRGYPVSSATYDAKDINAMTKSAAQFLNSAGTDRTSLPVVKVNFEAIFLPDSWRNMELVISTLNYHGASKMILIGTSLWEQGLSAGRSINTKTYALAFYPSSFSVTNPAPATEKFVAAMHAAGQTPDDWSVLGYDFIMTAAELGMTSCPADLTQINARLTGLQAEFAGAPFSWDADGHASRALFPAQPASGGSVRLDPSAFSRYRQNGGAMPNFRSAPAAAPEATASQPGTDR